MLCLQQRLDATCGTPPFNLNLQVDLEAIFASLYMPFTSPPNSPPKAHAARHRDDKWQKWDGPQIAHARAKARRGNLGPVPKYL